MSKVSKKEIKKNESADVSYDFSAVEPVSIQSVLTSQASGTNLPVIGGIQCQMLVLIYQFLKD